MNMKNTYKTYQECKLANPDCTIITCFTNSEGSKNKVVEFEALTRDHFSREVADWVVCNHTDYLPSAEWFFSEGYKLVEGDAIVDLMGNVLFVGSGSHADFCNYKTGDENEFFILRAKALLDETKYLNSAEDSIKETVSEQFAELVKKAPIFTPHLQSSSVDLNQEKPRTKVEYEKVEFESTADAYRTMLDGEKLYSQDGESEFLFDGKNFVGIDSDGGVYTLECHSSNEPFYRKVERPVEWWEDAVEYLNQNRQSGSCDEQDVLSVGADMTRDQWCDFARILLEQEGE